MSYDQQMKIDHCGGAAACIALAFMHAYKNDQIGRKLALHSYYRKVIEQKLYKGASSTLFGHGENLKTTQRPKCRCGRSFYKLNQLQLHARSCSKQVEQD